MAEVLGYDFVVATRCSGGILNLIDNHITDVLLASPHLVGFVKRLYNDQAKTQEHRLSQEGCGFR